MSSKFKLTEDLSPKRLTSSMETLKNKLKLIQSSIKMKWSMFWESPKVRDSKESLRDGVLNIFKRSPTEGIEKSVVSDHGIQPE